MSPETDEVGVCNLPHTPCAPTLGDAHIRWMPESGLLCWLVSIFFGSDVGVVQLNITPPEAKTRNRLVLLHSMKHLQKCHCHPTLALVEP